MPHLEYLAKNISELYVVDEFGVGFIMTAEDFLELDVVGDNLFSYLGQLDLEESLLALVLFYVLHMHSLLFVLTGV